ISFTSYPVPTSLSRPPLLAVFFLKKNRADESLSLAVRLFGQLVTNTITFKNISNFLLTDAIPHGCRVEHQMPGR
ncbi:MAG: hypothetical protein M1609_14030, partial [Firmicutes bacterium]|nr:hypothetical protein [Bacillota bacterium]